MPAPPANPHHAMHSPQLARPRRGQLDHNRITSSRHRLHSTRQRRCHGCPPFDYDTYGKLRGTGEASSFESGTDAEKAETAYRYTGKRSDPVSETTHHGARQYSALTRGWLVTDQYLDPLADYGLSMDPTTRDRTQYAGGNPMNYVDDDGHAYDCDGSHGCDAANENYRDHYNDQFHSPQGTGGTGTGSGDDSGDGDGWFDSLTEWASTPASPTPVAGGSSAAAGRGAGTRSSHCQSSGRSGRGGFRFRAARSTPWAGRGLSWWRWSWLGVLSGCEIHP